jgi:HlyD family secretion protein
MNETISELLKHKAVVAALGAVGVILVGSVAYYAIESRPPALAYAAATEGAITEDVTANGTVSPVENPDLSFAVGGRVTTVNAAVGDKVYAGELLASLDTGVLSANLAAANANLSGLTAGPRAVDLASKQTAVDQANAAVNNTYASLSANIADAAAQAEDAVHSTDPLFGSMNVVDHPRVKFLSEDSSEAEKAGQERGDLNDMFDDWNRGLESLTASSTPDELDAALSEAVSNLIKVRTFFTDFTATVNAADPKLDPAVVAGVSTERSNVNSLILSLQGTQQSLTNEKLAVQSAKDALNLLNAGATPEAVQAGSAQVNAARAALSQAEVVAPFSGTVAAVNVKPGDIASPNAPAISILPDSNFEVEVYLSEIDMAKLATGDKADVTLDAYGTGKVFPATVATIDKATTIVNGVPSYKVTLVFDAQDPALASGQGANAVIHAGQKDNALLVPKSAIATGQNGTYVLVKSPNGPVETPVTVGLIGTENVEILSGLTAGQEVAEAAGD